MVQLRRGKGKQTTNLSAGKGSQVVVWFVPSLHAHEDGHEGSTQYVTILCNENKPSSLGCKFIMKEHIV